MKQEGMDKHISKIKVWCRECGWTGTRGDCGFGHNDFYCPNCCKESIKDVKPEALGGKG